MYPPIALRYLGVFGLAALFLLELQIIEAAYHKQGMSHRAIVSLLLVTILGSYIMPVVLLSVFGASSFRIVIQTRENVQR
jgi:hypothetical protein